jgi:Ca-activated chloride channel homolog
MEFSLFAPGFLLFGLTILVWLFFVWREKHNVIYFRSSQANDGKISRQRLARAGLGILVLLLLTFWLADPRIVETRNDTSKNGIDIALVVDVSTSMLAEDMAPNRIKAAKRELVRFVEARKNDRISLTIFAGKPFLLSPLTFDTNALVNIVESIGVDSIRQRDDPKLSGTAIGDGLLLGIESLKNEPDREKIIVLLTDGEANVGIDPRASALYAMEKNVSIYTIGLWDPKWTELYTTDTNGNRKFFFDDRTKKPLIATIDEKLLKYMAESSGGTYANATSSEGLTAIFEKLATLRQKPIADVTDTTTIPLAPYFFLLGIACCGGLLYFEGRRLDSWLSSPC